MHEQEIADCLDLMLDSIKLIESRFLKVGSPGEFAKSSEGITLLDAIAMRLQVIGESVRKIQKMDPSYLDPYSGVEWDKIARFRDLVSHHYNQLDHDNFHLNAKPVSSGRSLFNWDTTPIFSHVFY